MSSGECGISLVLALGLSAAGVAGVVFELLFAAHPMGRLVMGSGFVAALGLYWLWVDFINVDPRPET